MKTEVVKLNGDKEDVAKIELAAKLLDDGGLVAFPTETVYGIGCAVRTESIKRLDTLKARSPDKHYTLHIAEKDNVWDYVSKIPLRGRKLIEKGWPGPLTIVFEIGKELLAKQKIGIHKETFEILYRSGSIGIRCPDNVVASSLLRQANFPIVAPSANLASKDPATTAEETMKYLEGKIEMVLQKDDSCRYKQSSTVVKVEKNTVTVLREGVYSSSDIKDMSEIKILFVCTGNTCRSPMAEAFCRKYISEKLECDIDEVRDMGYKISSAGTLGNVGMPASAEVISICQLKGVDMTGHQSSGLSREELLDSDYIFVMSRYHLDSIGQVCPSVMSKCLLLDEKVDIGDPIGGGEKIYRRCAQQIEEALKKRISEILDEDSSRK